MQMTRINPDGVLRHPGFTRVITLEGPTKLAFFAGQTPQGDDMGPLFPGDLKAQYLFVMDKLELQLQAVGCTWDNVIVRRLYLTDMEAFFALRRDDPEFPGYFKELPCSTGIEVKQLMDPDWMVEVEIIAALPD